MALKDLIWKRSMLEHLVVKTARCTLEMKEDDMLCKSLWSVFQSKEDRNLPTSVKSNFRNGN